MKTRKMRPGGKSADRDALRRNAVLRRVRAHPLHRRRQRGERTGPERRRSTVIPQYKGLDAVAGEGAARRSTLADGAVLIAAARAEEAAREEAARAAAEAAAAQDAPSGETATAEANEAAEAATED